MDKPEIQVDDYQIKYKDIQVVIDDDSMTATVNLRSLPDNEEIYNYNDVKSALSEAGVKMGIDEELINNIIEQKMYDQDIVIAKGKQSEDGKDGYFKFNFETDIDSKPVVQADGTVDYYNIKRFETAKEGDKLVEYIPPTQGVFGYDVRGKLLTPKAGKPKTPIRGRGFRVSEDGNTYYAAMDGKIQYRNSELKIASVLEITGNVDIGTGNIDFNGDVKISGSVASGITINSMGSIFIGGSVEGAIIKAAKDVVIQQGVNAHGKGRIEAKGDITAKFFENATLLAEGNIKAGYILNCNAEATGKVIVEGKKGAIHGGTVCGVMGVESQQIGNDSYAPTNISVGITTNIRRRYAGVLDHLKELDTQISSFDEIMNKYNELKEKCPEKYNPMAYTKVFQSKIVKSAEKTQYEQEKAKLSEIIENSLTSVVLIKGRLYPGVRIYIESLCYQPEEVLSHLIVKKFNGKIAVRDCRE